MRGGRMKKYRFFVVATIFAILIMVPSAFFQTQKSTPKVILPTEMKFVVNPSDPAGLQTMLLDGDPTKPELYTSRVKIPANFRLLAHWHPETRSVIVLSGTFYYGYGEKFDEKKLIEMPPGTFLVNRLSSRILPGLRAAMLFFRLREWGRQEKRN
jgi:hypothetical protein